MGGLPRPPGPLGTARLTAVRWIVDPEPPGAADLDAEALIWLVRPAGALATARLARIRPTPADLSDAATWDTPERGAARLRRRLLLRVLAAEALGVGDEAVEVVRERTGRPRLAAPEAAYVSVARRGDWAALAVARRPVGVDLEVLEDAPDWSLLSVEDADVAGRTADADGASLAFATAWASREAYLKATGAGLAGAADVQLRLRGADLWVDGPAGPALSRRRVLDGCVAVAVVL